MAVLRATQSQATAITDALQLYSDVLKNHLEKQRETGEINGFQFLQGMMALLNISSVITGILDQAEKAIELPEFDLDLKEDTDIIFKTLQDVRNWCIETNKTNPDAPDNVLSESEKMIEKIDHALKLIS